MFDTICTLPLPADLFAQTVHPSEPILTVGLSSGHVLSYRLPADEEQADSDSSNNLTAPTLPATNGNGPTPIISNFRRSSSASENGLGSIDTIWKTRRHVGSCRCVSYNHDGSLCYSGGTDGLVKAFNSETGKVVSKIAIAPDEDTGEDDAPTVLHALSPQALLVGTDSGKLYLYDLRQGGVEMQAKAAKFWQPHEDQHVNSLCPLPVSETSTSGFPKQWVTVGGSTLVVTDLRKGIISTSEDQEAELTTAVCIQGLKKGGTSVGEKVLVGQGDGVVSLWERGVWGDQDERLVVNRTQSGIESMVEVPLGFGKGKLKMNEKLVATGLEDGAVRFLRVGRNGVLGEWDIRHDEIEGVVGLDFDVAGRLVSGGGQVVKVWTEAKGIPGGGRQASKRAMDSDDSDDEEEQDDSSDEEDRSKRKKRKRKTFDRRTVVAVATAFSLGLVVRGFLQTGKYAVIVPSPRTTLLPKLPNHEHGKLPYPPDSLPGARDVNTPYGSIRIYEFGPEDGPQVLLVHGISTPCLALGGVAHQLADKGCRVMLFDLFGRGYSDNPGDLPHDLRLFSTQILIALASSPMSWRSFSIAGYSLGGGIAAGFTSYFTDMIDNLILICPSGLIRARHFSKTNRVIYSEGVIPEPLLLRLVKRRLKTPLYPPKPSKENGKIGAAKAVKAEVPIGSNSAAILSKKHPEVTIDKAVVHQVDNHDGFVSAFMSSIRYGPIQHQHPLWDRISESWKSRSADSGKTHKVLVIAGERDSIIDAKELREDATEIFGDHMSYHIISAGHDVPIIKPDEVADLIWQLIR